MRRASFTDCAHPRVEADSVPLQPCTLNAAESKYLIDLAKEKGCFFMEGERRARSFSYSAM